LSTAPPSPRSGSTPAEDFASFERALVEADIGAAVRVVERLLDAGADPVALMVDLIAEAQHRIGERWQRGEWTVSQEHAVTGVPMAATEAIARFLEGTPVSRGHVVIGCAEREWHALPALMVANGLRAGGWAVTYLGAATSPARLSVHLQELGPDATAVSCSTLRALPSTRGFIEASTDAGIPIMAVGAAFGPDAQRALALGATAWAGGVVEAIELLPTLPTVVAPATPLPAEPLAEQRAMELSHDWLASTLREGWRPVDALGEIAEGVADEIATVAADSIDRALYSVQGALVTGDARIVSDTARSVGELLTARGLPRGLLDSLGELLGGELHEYPIAAEMTRGHWRVREPATS
jgi:methanogenic corrinoid protein MtbC1